MTKTSEYGEYHDVPTTAFNENSPLSACYTLVLNNNARHLRDEKTQYRVNWAGYRSRYLSYDSANRRIDGVNYDGTTSTYQHCLTHIFPWAISHEVGPLAPVVYMQGYAETTGSTFYAVAYMLPYQHPQGDYRRDEGVYQSGKAWKFVAETDVASSIQEMIAEAGASKQGDATMSGDGLANGSFSYKTWELDSNDATQEYNHYCYLYRFSLYCKGEGHSNSLAIREFNK